MCESWPQGMGIESSMILMFAEMGGGEEGGKGDVILESGKREVPSELQMPDINSYRYSWWVIAPLSLCPS